MLNHIPHCEFELSNMCLFPSFLLFAHSSYTVHLCFLMSLLFFFYFLHLKSLPNNPPSFSLPSSHQSVLSIQEGSSPSLAFTISARWTRWRRSVGPCTSAWWRPASPPRERLSSPCSSGPPSEGLCCHFWIIMTGADLSSSTTQTEVKAQWRIH